MKKKKLKLNLKKDVISKLQAQSIVGGDTDILCGSNYCPTRQVGCPRPTFDNNTCGDCESNFGCTGNPDETMTCQAWGC